MATQSVIVTSEALYHKLLTVLDAQKQMATADAQLHTLMGDIKGTQTRMSNARAYDHIRTEIICAHDAAYTQEPAQFWSDVYTTLAQSRNKTPYKSVAQYEAYSDMLELVRQIFYRVNAITLENDTESAIS